MRDRLIVMMLTYIGSRKPLPCRLETGFDSGFMSAIIRKSPCWFEIIIDRVQFVDDNDSPDSLDSLLFDEYQIQTFDQLTVAGRNANIRRLIGSPWSPQLPLSCILPSADNERAPADVIVRPPGRLITTLEEFVAARAGAIAAILPQLQTAEIANAADLERPGPAPSVPRNSKPQPANEPTSRPRNTLPTRSGSKAFRSSSRQMPHFGERSPAIDGRDIGNDKNFAGWRLSRQFDDLMLPKVPHILLGSPATRDPAVGIPIESLPARALDGRIRIASGGMVSPKRAGGAINISHLFLRGDPPCSTRTHIAHRSNSSIADCFKVAAGCVCRVCDPRPPRGSALSTAAGGSRLLWSAHDLPDGWDRAPSPAEINDAVESHPSHCGRLMNDRLRATAPVCDGPSGSSVGNRYALTSERASQLLC